MSGFKTISVRTSRYIEMIDITHEVRQYVSEQGVEDGIVVAYTPHTTAGITINENADPAVTSDITAFLERKIPHESYFRHMEGNTPSHIMSSYFSASETLIIDRGNLILGTWQGIYLGEHRDHGGNRRILVTYYG